MPDGALTFAGASLAIVWGIAHLVPTRGVVAGFGEISADNRRIILMEWVAEGLALVFVGALPLLVRAVASASDPVVAIVGRASSAMLLVMAVWTGLTGSRTSILPMKVCPLVKTTAAALILLGTGP